MKNDKKMQADEKCIICEIYWERIFLHLVIESAVSTDISFVLKNLDTQTIHPLEIEKYEDGKYFFCLNITAMDVRSFLENGKWTVAYSTKKEEAYTPCFVTTELAYRLEQLTRIFRYGGEAYAYTVDFSVYSEDQINLSLQMKSYFMARNNKWNKRTYINKPNLSPIISKMINEVFSVGILGMNAWYCFCRIFKKKNHINILLMNETNELNAGNLQAIDKRLKERHLDEKIRVSYSFRQAVGKHVGIVSWIKLIYRIAVQDIIILDNFAPVFSFLKLKKDVELIQVWHAGGGFKAVGYCRFGKDGSPFPTGSCHKAYTTALTGSPQLIKVFEEVFGIEKEAFFPVGMPRLDGYLDENRIADFRVNFYKQYPEFKAKKIILFAPTYRGKGQSTAYYDYKRIDLKQIYDVCGEEYVFLVKMHPFVKKQLEIPDEMNDRIFDFSTFSSINDLFYVTEILITDYSSNFYEFSLMKKPMLFYTYDRNIYELTRGVYRSIKDSAPGKVCDTFEELIQAIRNKDYEYEKVSKFVEENFGDFSGTATDQLIDYIILKKRNKND